MRKEVEKIDKNNIFPKKNMDKKLCFVRSIGESVDGYGYEFFYSDDTDNFWGEHFGEKPASIVNDLRPEDEYTEDAEIVVLPIELSLINDSNCFSYQDAMDGIVSIAWCYNDGRFVAKFEYGEGYDDTNEKISKINDEGR